MPAYHYIDPASAWTQLRCGDEEYGWMLSSLLAQCSRAQRDLATLVDDAEPGSLGRIVRRLDDTLALLRAEPARSLARTAASFEAVGTMSLTDIAPLIDELKLEIEGIELELTDAMMRLGTPASDRVAMPC